MEEYKIYCVNLEKEVSRRKRAETLLKRDGLLEKTKFFKAINKDDVNEAFLRDNGFKIFEHNYEPSLERSWFSRGVNVGEIGCATSHYFCWLDFYHSSLDYAVFMEDDNFWQGEGRLRNEIEEFIKFHKDNKSVDMIYFGRTRPNHAKEEHIKEEEFSEKYLIANYSYNTHCYLLTKLGVKKILGQKPMENIMALDEMLCSMFIDNHPHKKINETFKANLKVLAIKNDEKNKDDKKYMGFCFQVVDDGMSSTDITGSEVYEGEKGQNEA